MASMPKCSSSTSTGSSDSSAQPVLPAACSTSSQVKARPVRCSTTVATGGTQQSCTSFLRPGAEPGCRCMRSAGPRTARKSRGRASGCVRSRPSYHVPIDALCEHNPSGSERRRCVRHDAPSSRRPRFDSRPQPVRRSPITDSIRPSGRAQALLVLRVQRRPERRASPAKFQSRPRRACGDCGRCSAVLGFVRKQAGVSRRSCVCVSPRAAADARSRYTLLG